MSWNITHSLSIEVLQCCSCGIQFFVEEVFKSNLKENKQSFFCPNGHKQSFTESESDLLRKKVASLNADLGAKDRLIAQLKLTQKKTPGRKPNG